MSEFIDTSQAMLLLKEQYGIERTRPTIITWCTQRKIGKKVGGRFVVDRKSLIALVEGNEED